MNSTTIGNLPVFEVSGDWTVFKERLGFWLSANGIKRTEKGIPEGDDRRRAVLLSALSESAYLMVRKLISPKSVTQLSYEEIVKELDKYLLPKKSLFVERHRFYIAVQREDEDMTQWAARVRQLSACCQFGSVLDEMLRDRFVLGMQPGPERDHLFTEDADTLTLARAHAIAVSLHRTRNAIRQSTILCNQPKHSADNSKMSRSSSPNGEESGVGGYIDLSDRKRRKLMHMLQACREISDDDVLLKQHYSQHTVPEAAGQEQHCIETAVQEIDLCPIKVEQAEDSNQQEGVMTSAYMPEADDPPPHNLTRLVSADSNMPHDPWGMTTGNDSVLLKQQHIHHSVSEVAGQERHCMQTPENESDLCAIKVEQAEDSDEPEVVITSAYMPEADSSLQDNPTILVSADSNMHHDLWGTTTENDSDSSSDELYQGIGQMPFVTLTCRTIRIGSYKYKPKEKVTISSKGIKIFAPALKDETRDVPLEIQVEEVDRVQAHFRNRMFVIFLYTMDTCGTYIRKALNMEDKIDPYYNPISKSESHKRITLLPDSISEDAKMALKIVFGKKMEELSHREANTILLKTCNMQIKTGHSKLSATFTKIATRS